MAQIYETVGETDTRLAGTFFLHKGQLVYCENSFLGSDEQVWLHLLPYPERVNWDDVPLCNPDLEFRKFQLGYVNTPDGATYASRIPAKGRYKQGLCKDNVLFTQLKTSNGQPHYPRFNDVIGRPSFLDMLKGKYPSMREAIQRIREANVPSVAFHPSFSLSLDQFTRQFYLNYKGEKVGFSDNDIFQVPKEFSYLKEVLAKSGIKIR